MYYYREHYISSLYVSKCSVYVRSKGISNKVLGLTCDNNQRENNHVVLKQRDIYVIYVQSIKIHKDAVIFNMAIEVLANTILVQGESICIVNIYIHDNMHGLHTS